MAVDVTTAVTIGRSRHDVASFAVDPDNALAWYRNIKAVSWETTKPLTVGSRFTFQARFLNRTLVYTYEVAEFVPGEHFVMKTAAGPFPMETTYAWEEIGGGTKMTLRNRGEPSGFSRVMAPLMTLAMRHANKQDLARLKVLLDGATP